MRPKVFKVQALHDPSTEERELIQALGPFAITPGVHLLIDADNEKIIEHALLYLNAKHGRDGIAKQDGGEPSLRSSKASAYELAEWLGFLARLGRSWDDADHEIISLYAHTRASRLSHHTGRNRESSTIAHKLSTVYGFYGWYNSMKVTDVRWDETIVRASYRSAQGGREACDREIRPFAPKELQRLLQLLGPLPSELKGTSTRPTRDRLVFETGLLTGMRGEEIAHLTVDMIKRLMADPKEPDATQPLEITITKRRRKRYVAMPNSLIIELRRYIRTERQRAVDAMGGPDHGRLFVSLPGASNTGTPMTTSTIHRRTHALMVRAGLAEQRSKSIKGESVPYMHTLHSFHDTRHTYAVNLYILQKRAGDTQPWKTVQVMLGHKDWATTEEYYLQSVGVFEPAIGFRLSRYWEDAK